MNESEKATHPKTWIAIGSLVAALGVCAASCGMPAEGLMEAGPAAVTVKFDLDARPLPEIPLPNDIATRPDSDSATGRRINASVIAPTGMERRMRELIDTLDGWGLQQPISIPFTGPIDVQSVIDGHDDVDYDISDDVVYLINIDEDSEEFGRVQHLDVGNGNYPVGLELFDRYGPNDPRGWTLSLVFEEEDEDKNGNGKLDPGEDTDADGVLDRPNYLPGHLPLQNDLAGRADALMTFYERETNTLIVAPMLPLQEKTTYAVVVTRRIKDLDGMPVGSPFRYINHLAQTEALDQLLEALPEGLGADDIAFTFAFTTQTAESAIVAVRDGLYGHGVQGHLGKEFPAELDEIFKLKDEKYRPWQGKNLHILHHEDWSSLLELMLLEFLGADPNSEQTKALLDANRYIDYHVMGSFESPQLFMREDADGNRLPLDLQSWPQDLDHKPAEARSELVYFWLVIPRKEVSARGRGRPVPLVLLGHGYTSSRISEIFGFACFMAQFGMATLAIDNVSHGLGVGPDLQIEISAFFESLGLGPGADVIFLDRSEDLDNDGTKDSGADFWTSYTFHTRDMMRQSAFDYMQLIRIVRQWDGEKRWNFDLTGDGSKGIAGDFDGDGVVDIGADSPIHAVGGSLGGIMSSILGGVEPEVSTVVPVSGGGRLTDVGVRSRQGGVPQAVIVRLMGPIYHTTLRSDGVAEVGTYVTELNSAATIALAEIEGLLPGDTMVVENLENGEVGCGYLLPDETNANVDARARAQVASDAGDLTEIRFYRGPSLVAGSTECEVIEGADPIAIVDRREFPSVYLGRDFEPGELRSFVEGLGFRRANPEMRRFLSLGQMVLDPADPAVFSRHFTAQPLEFPGTGQTVHTNARIVTTVGDMNVPANSGITVGRAAGFINYLEPRSDYNGTIYEGRPPNQILIDTYIAESVNTYKRFTYNDDPDAEGVHMDVENFSGGTDLWGDSVPRLDPPLRMVATVDSWGNELGGYSGAIFPYGNPEGMHGFPLPGDMTDRAIARCEAAGGPDCSALIGEVFDIGWYMFHGVCRFMRNEASEYPFLENCNTKQACNDIPDTPALRDPQYLP